MFTINTPSDVKKKNFLSEHSFVSFTMHIHFGQWAASISLVYQPHRSNHVNFLANRKILFVEKSFSEAIALMI